MCGSANIVGCMFIVRMCNVKVRLFSKSCGMRAYMRRQRGYKTSVWCDRLTVSVGLTLPKNVKTDTSAGNMLSD